MVEIGGTGFMVLGALLGAGFCALLALALTRRFGWVSAWSACGLLWWLGVIALVTLVPLDTIDYSRPAGSVSRICSYDYGGPAPDGFWIFSGGQRVLNTVLFVPAGALWVLTVARWRAGWLLVPLGLGGLLGFSVLIEWTQLQAGRIGRACDITDVVDNGTGAAIGIGVGLVLAVVFRPWRRRGKWAPSTRVQSRAHSRDWEDEEEWIG